jgi:hypothetical protein
MILQKYSKNIKVSLLFTLSFEHRQNEGTFSCETLAHVFGQPNVPDSESVIFIFPFCLYAA